MMKERMAMVYFVIRVVSFKHILFYNMYLLDLGAGARVCIMHHQWCTKNHNHCIALQYALPTSRRLPNNWHDVVSARSSPVRPCTCVQ